ncbi:AAEL008400-PA [Aedes aegypti]|uniref:AAEL008400-PA n=1 Tax=Aedes aegypti TaxID=7159 RepID=Q16YW0_AEDAE|nr:AAEL008400-PA [Aedes aegypti]
MEWFVSLSRNDKHSHTVFLVQVPKGTRGLGLSVSGGSDSSAPFPGLIRIKRLFPHQAAWATGMLQPGDILLEANGIPLTGLTNYEALEVLRTAPNYVTLTVCRPQDEQYRKLSPPSEPPKPPLRNALSSEPQSQVQSPQLSGIVGGGGPGGQLMQFQHLQYNQQQQMVPYYYQQQQQQQQYIYPPQTLAFAPLESMQSNGSISGEFEIILTKQQGSLGFTLRKEDESILGHCVRALVRDPALNDGRIKPGDKIMAVNDVPISQMTHEEAVIFLRQAADVVKLRLYRDQAQTPLSAQSPTLGDRRLDLSKSDSTSTVGGTGKPKPNLRPEALNLLTDIAYRKQSIATNNSGGGSGSTSSSVKSSNASPRRLRRGLPQQQQQQSHRTYDNHGYQHSETSNYSDSETSTIVSQGGSMHQQHHPIQGVQMVPGGLIHTGSCRSCGGAGNVGTLMEENLDESYYCDDEIDIESLYEDDGEPQKRPNFLNLAGESGSTPMSSRKPRFQFSVAPTNAYELNNLDNEALDAPTMYALNGDPVNGQPPGSDQFISLPCETFLVACKTENDLNADSTDAIYVKHFAHKSPLYSSVNVPLKDTGGNVSEVVDAVEKGGKKSLMKWKGAVLISDEDETPSSHVYSSGGSLDDGTSPSLSAETGTGTITSDTPESSLAATLGTSTTTPTTERELDFNGGGIDSEGNKIFTVELNKGWSSRLGFSLQQEPDTKRTVISAIYSESVAAKDGRLRVGDQLLMVNEESVESMSTAQIINLLRIIRGSICLRLIRRTGQYSAIPEQSEGEVQQECDLPPPPDDLIITPPDTSKDLDEQEIPTAEQ